MNYKCVILNLLINYKKKKKKPKKLTKHKQKQKKNICEEDWFDDGLINLCVG